MTSFQRYAGLSAALFCTLCAATVTAHATTPTTTTVLVRSNDYDGDVYTNPSYTFAGNVSEAVLTGVQGYAGIGVGTDVFAGQMLWDSGPLGESGIGGTISNLPVGGSINLSFLLATIDAWGGANPATGGPDAFQLLTNNTLYYSTFISNYSLTSTNGGTLLDAGNYGGNPRVTDAAWNFTNVAALQNIAYSGTTFSFALRAAGEGWAGGPTESWAIDNLMISVNVPNTVPVPEPETYALMLAGLAGLGFAARKRAQR